jgi:ABC-2 type transport system permease protein
MGGQPPPEPKGDIRTFMHEIGVAWPVEDVVWDTYNPHPRWSENPPEVVFVGAASGASAPFNPDDAAVSGLQEVVCIFGGHLKSADREGITFTPLIRTRQESGTLPESTLYMRNPFGGGGGFNPNRPHHKDNTEHVLAARLDGIVKAVVLADADALSDVFFQFRRDAPPDIQLDNVTMFLNLIDSLTGDTTFVDLRKRRVRHRTLTTFERREKDFEQKRLDMDKQAEELAEAQLKEAQARLDSAADEILRRTDLDETSKQFMVRQRQEAENRHFEAKKSSIEDEKNRSKRQARIQKNDEIKTFQSRVRWLAVLLPLMPSLVLALTVFLFRLVRERRGA